MKTKSYVSVFLSVVMTILCITSVSAAVGNTEIVPLWLYTSKGECTIDFSGTDGTVGINVIGISSKRD